MRDVLNSFLRIAKLITTRDLEELRVIYGPPQCALPKGGTLKVDKLDRLPSLHIHRNQSKVRTTLHSIPRADRLAFGRQHSGCPVHSHLSLTKFDRMKPQTTTPQVLQHLLFVQHRAIGSHQHVIVRVQPFKSNVVLLLQCTIESVRVDTQYLLCRHSISSLSSKLFLSCLRDRRLDRVLVRFPRISVAQEDLYVPQKRFSVLIKRCMT